MTTEQKRQHVARKFWTIGSDFHTYSWDEARDVALARGIGLSGIEAWDEAEVYPDLLPATRVTEPQEMTSRWVRKMARNA